MASTIVLKRRISSIKGTRQITKAMQLVSASKLRRAQEYAVASREYRDLAYDLLRRLSALPEAEISPLFKKRPVKTRLYILVTTNTGLAGAFTSNTLKLLTQGLTRDRHDGVKSQVITIGSKGAQFVRHLSSVELSAAYPPYGDKPTANDIQPLLKSVIQKYEDQSVDEIDIIYTKFITTVSQQAHIQQLLPAPLLDNPGANSSLSNFEPDAETVIEQVIIRLIEAQIWQAVLESLASEHAMRMLATKNATDNANDLIKDYTLELNTARQAAITQELAEISGGAEALNG